MGDFIEVGVDWNMWLLFVDLYVNVWLIMD